MAEQLTLEQVEQQVTKLSPHDQLALVAHISDRLRTLLPTAPPPTLEEGLEREREQKVAALLALCDAAAEQWPGDFDSAEEIRQMRRQRDEQLWPNK